MYRTWGQNKYLAYLCLVLFLNSCFFVKVEVSNPASKSSEGSVDTTTTQEESVTSTNESSTTTFSVTTTTTTLSGGGAGDFSSGINLLNTGYSQSTGLFSDLKYLTIFQNHVYGTAVHPLGYRKIFTLDGTPAVAFQVNMSGDDAPEYLQNWENTHLFFAARKDGRSQGFYYNGTSVTYLPQPSSGSYTDPRLFSALGSDIYFIARNENGFFKLFHFDGSTTTQLSNTSSAGHDYQIDYEISFYKRLLAGGFVKYGSYIYLVLNVGTNGITGMDYDNELYRVSGSSLNSVFGPQAGSDRFAIWGVYNSKLYFNSQHNGEGDQLYSYNGTALTRVTNIAGSEPDKGTLVGNKLYFSWGISANELYYHDITTADSVTHVDVINGLDDGINNMWSDGVDLYFNHAHDGTVSGLAKWNGIGYNSLLVNQDASNILFTNDGYAYVQVYGTLYKINTSTYAATNISNSLSIGYSNRPMPFHENRPVVLNNTIYATNSYLVKGTNLLSQESLNASSFGVNALNYSSPYLFTSNDNGQVQIHESSNLFYSENSENPEGIAAFLWQMYNTIVLNSFVVGNSVSSQLDFVKYNPTSKTQSSFTTTMVSPYNWQEFDSSIFYICNASSKRLCEYDLSTEIEHPVPGVDHSVYSVVQVLKYQNNLYVLAEQGNSTSRVFKFNGSTFTELTTMSGSLIYSSGNTKLFATSWGVFLSRAISDAGSIYDAFVNGNSLIKAESSIAWRDANDFSDIQTLDRMVEYNGTSYMLGYGINDPSKMNPGIQNTGGTISTSLISFSTFGSPNPFLTNGTNLPLMNLFSLGNLLIALGPSTNPSQDFHSMIYKYNGTTSSVLDLGLGSKQYIIEESITELDNGTIYFVAYNDISDTADRFLVKYTSADGFELVKDPSTNNQIYYCQNNNRPTMATDGTNLFFALAQGGARGPCITAVLAP